MTRNDPEEAWLAALAGKRPPGAPPAPGSDDQLAVRSGELIRARFAKALRDVHAAPDPETTRAKILAAAAAGRPAVPRHQRTLAFASAAGAGLAAGIVGTLLLLPPRSPAPPDFADVESGHEVADDTEMRAASPQAARTFVVISRNVGDTVEQLTRALVRAGATFRVTEPEDGGVQFDVQRMSSVPQSLTEAAAALHIEFPPGTAIRVHIIDHAAK